MSYKDPEVQREYQRKWQASRRTAYFEGKVCVLCGSDERLELDHLDPATKVYAPAALWGMSDSNPKKIAELAKCRVLCYECHLNKSKTENTKGEERVNHVLTEIEVLEIRSLHGSGLFSYRDLSEIYGIHSTNIGRVVRKEDWKHV